MKSRGRGISDGAAGPFPRPSGPWQTAHRRAKTLVLLHRFQGLNDGIYPLGPVIIDSSGFLYGATELGPKGHCYTKGYGCGTIWKLFVGGSDKGLAQ